MDDKLHNVKVYVMVEDQQWKGIGAGQISFKYVERFQGMCLLVHSESDGSLIMESKIHPNVPYYKQRREIIIWSEAKNHGMAIYFQEPNGCQEIWEDIYQVQGKDPSIEITQELSDGLETFEVLLPIWNLAEMSNCELHILQNIADLFTFVNETPSHKERLALVLEKGGYVKKLLQLFHTIEKLKNMEGLHCLNSIIKGILFLNDARLFNIMFSDEFFMVMLGCLEYDPASDQPKQYREFLTQNAKFKEIMPITDSQLRQTIEQTYRMQYVQDIVLPTPSIFEPNLLSDLTAMIIYNKIQIIIMLQDDENFLIKVLAQLKDNTVCDERRHELLLFFKEFCSFAETLENREKDELLKTLINLGIMSALKVLVRMRDYQIQIAALNIFPYLVGYSPCIVREYLLEEAQVSEDNEDLLINIMIKQMISDTNPEFSHGIIFPEILCTLLDPEHIHVTDSGCEKEEFLNFFYTRCISNLIAPILSTKIANDNANNRANIYTDNYQNAQLLGVVLEILTFCVQYHSTYMKNYILTNNLLSRILVLMSSKHTFLILCAVRFMRKMIGFNDEIYNVYIIKKNLFEPVVHAFMRNGHRYNMLNSAIIELFEFIRQENIKSLIANIVENFFIAFESIEYVQTFKGLKIKYREEKKRELQVRRNLHNVVCQKIYCKLTNVMEVKVKADVSCRGITTREGAILPKKRDFPSHYDKIMKEKERNESENVIEHQKIKSSEASKCCPSHEDGSANSMSSSHCTSLVPLVDDPYDTYGDDDDDNPHSNDKDEGEDEPPQKRPNLSS